MPPFGTACDRLDVQGYTHVDLRSLKTVEPWLRWSPAVCAVFMAIGTVFASPLILWGVIPFSLTGALSRRHPFDYVYNRGLRRFTGTPPLPTHGAPRRFACALASVWLAGTGAAFALDAETLGYVLGGSLTVVAAIVATTHFCIPSLVYGFLFGPPRPRAELPAATE